MKVKIYQDVINELEVITNEMRSKRRGILTIIFDMLIDLAERPLKKSQLKYKSNLNYGRASKYLTFMLNLELVANLKDSPSNFLITKKGREYLSSFHEMSGQE